MNRIEKINNFGQIKIQKEIEKKEAEEKEYNEVMKEIEALTPRIKELIKTEAACQSNGIDIPNTFYSNFTRNFGFVKTSSNGVENFFREIGFVGFINFYTDGVKETSYVNNSSSTKLKASYIKENFIDKFDNFEKEFYDYVDDIIE